MARTEMCGAVAAKSQDVLGVGGDDDPANGCGTSGDDSGIDVVF